MLKISQEFMLLGMNNKKYISMTSNVRLSLVTAGVMDLILAEVIEIDNKKLIVVKELPSELDFLSTLYGVINKKGSIKLSKLSESFTMKNKEFKNLKIDIENSIELLNDFDKNKEPVIERMRAEFLENDISDETIILAALLNKNKKLKQYFSKHEIESIKQKIKELKKDESNHILNIMINNIDAITVVLFSGAIF